jgi:hypothetical protein
MLYLDDNGPKPVRDPRREVLHGTLGYIKDSGGKVKILYLNRK